MESWNFLKKSNPKIGVATLAKRKSWVYCCEPNVTVCFWNPQVGIWAPFAPISFGPSGVSEEVKGMMLSVAPESTKKFNLLWGSLKNNNPEPCEKDIAVAVWTWAGARRCPPDGVGGSIGRTRRFPATGRGVHT